MKLTFLSWIFLIAQLFFSCTGNSPRDAAEEARPQESAAAVPEAPAGVLKQSEKSGDLLVYRIIRARKGDTIGDRMFMLYLDSASTTIESNIDSVIDLSLRIVRDRLDFTVGRSSADPTRLVKKGSANCIGYAAFFNAVFNDLVRRKNLHAAWYSEQFVAKLFYDGQPLSDKFTDPFFRDHDFNVITSSKGEKIAVDACLFEYFSVRRVRLAGS